MLVSLLRLISDLDDFAKKPVLDFREAQSGLTVLGVEIVQFIHPLLDAGPWNWGWMTACNNLLK